jgi:glutathione synthase/RimK-type ligase-like ATP-grasp enzyme
MMGIIFHPTKLQRIINGSEQKENMNYYFQMAQRHTVDLLFYSLECLSSHSSEVEGYIYSYQEDAVRKGKVSIPKVNLVRTVVLKKKDYSRLRKIAETEHVEFINLVPKRNKYNVSTYLRNFAEITDDIPLTERFSYQALWRLLAVDGKAIVKPTNGAFGERIIFVEKIEKGIHFSIFRKGKVYDRLISRAQFIEQCKKLKRKRSAYLVQQYIPSMEYMGQKVEIRTSPQKDQGGMWQITGMVARISQNSKLVTNLAQGGKAISFTEIEPFLPDHCIQKLHCLSLQIAKKLETLYPTVADIGLDLIIDQHYHVRFIEANFCDERLAYKESGDHHMWELSYRIPFEFALQRSKS